MRAVSKKTIALLSACSILLMFPACHKNADDNTTDPYVYIPQGGLSDLPEGQSVPNAESGFTVNRSWQKNFTLQYKYFDLSLSEETVLIRETRTNNAFAAEYLNKGIILYYKENRSNVDYYMIVKDDNNVHSVIQNKGIDDLSSTFMKLSDVSAEMPSLQNVMYMGEESVAGRLCKKYIQRAYQNGKAQETVYVWIDEEYGFAAKGESYDAQDKLTVSWELTLFKAGGVANNAIQVNVNDYTFIEQ